MDQQQDQGSRGPGKGGPPQSPLFRALDVNRDKVLSAEEIDNAAAALAKLDKNGDGQLTRDELMPQRPQGNGGESKEGGDQQQPPGDAGGPPPSDDGGQGGSQGRMQRPQSPIETALDADGDGVISKDEIAGAPAALRKLDKDGDGKVSLEECMPVRPEGQGGPGNNR